jgi:hypothetical protein
VPVSNDPSATDTVTPTPSLTFSVPTPTPTLDDPAAIPAPVVLTATPTPSLSDVNGSTGALGIQPTPTSEIAGIPGIAGIPVTGMAGQAMSFTAWVAGISAMLILLGFWIRRTVRKLKAKKYGDYFRD